MPEYDIGFGPLRGPGERGVVVPTDQNLVVPNLLLGTVTEIDSLGNPTSVVKATWGIPAAGADIASNTPNKVVEFWMAWRVHNADEADPDLTWSPSVMTHTRHAYVRQFAPNAVVDFRVQAKTGAGLFGPWSAASINTKQDQTPPEKPSKPTVSSALRGVTVVWDGRDYLGAEQPPDFDRCEIEISTESDTGGFALVGTFPRGGGSFYYNTTALEARRYWVRLCSIDTSFNRSAYSDVSDATSFDFQAAVAAEGGANSTSNSSFESWEGGEPLAWARTGTLESEESTDSYHGARSMLLRTSSGDSYYSQQTPCMPERTYYCSAWIKRAAGSTSFADRTLLAFDSTGKQAQAQLLSTVETGSWVRIRAVLTTDRNASTLQVRLYGAQVGEVRWDALQVEADGETPYSAKPGEIGPITVPDIDLSTLKVTTDMLVTGAVTGDKIREDAVTAAKLAVAAIDGSSGKLVANAVDATMIQAGAVVSEKIFAGSIGTDKLAANAVTAAKIAAGSITASKLTIGTMSANLVRNYAFTDGYNGWQLLDGQGDYAVEETRNNGSIGTSGTHHLKMNPPAGGVQLHYNGEWFPVQGGRYYYGSAQVYKTGGAAQITIYFWSAARQLIATSRVNFHRGSMTPAGIIEGQVQAPANAAFGSVAVYYYDTAGTAYVTNVEVRSVTVSALIQDGAIYTEKVSAIGISANKITAGTITASVRMMSPTIEAGTISAGTVNGATIIGGSIRGTRIETGEWFEMRVALTELAGIKDSIRWYGPGSSSTNPYTAIKGEIRGLMGNIGQYGIHLNGNVQLGHANAFLFQLSKRVAVGASVHGDISLRSGTVTGAVFSSGSSYRVNFESWMLRTPTYVGVTFTSIVVAHSVSDITTTGFTVHVRYLNGGTFAGQTASFVWYAEHLVGNPFIGRPNYSN